MSAEIGPTAASRVRPLDEGEVGRAGVLLARGMHDDPLFVHLLPEPERRALLLPDLLASLVRFGVRYGRAEAAGDGMAGVAVWTPPGVEMTPARMLRVGTVTAALRLGPVGLRRFAAFLRVTEAAHERAAPGPHWYLPVMAVEPTRQRRGIGGELLAAALARADAGDIPCYLETMNAATLSFYRRRIFAVAVEGALRDGTPFWGMLRPPGG